MYTHTNDCWYRWYISHRWALAAKGGARSCDLCTCSKLCVHIYIYIVVCIYIYIFL